MQNITEDLFNQMVAATEAASVTIKKLREENAQLKNQANAHAFLPPVDLTDWNAPATPSVHEKLYIDRLEKRYGIRKLTLEGEVATAIEQKKKQDNKLEEQTSYVASATQKGKPVKLEYQIIN